MESSSYGGRSTPMREGLSFSGFRRRRKYRSHAVFMPGVEK